MQNAKDSFYVALRDRLAVLNPARVMTLRAVQRPGILVEEAEAQTAELPNDVFVLRWAALTALQNMPSLLAGIGCEVHYASSGTLALFGLDRGRAVEEMDGELLQILQPMCTQKMRYTATPAVAMQTQVFWTEPVFVATETVRNQLIRVAKVTVFAFQEPGER